METAAAPPPDNGPGLGALRGAAALPSITPAPGHWQPRRCATRVCGGLAVKSCGGGWARTTLSPVLVAKPNVADPHVTRLALAVVSVAASLAIPAAAQADRPATPAERATVAEAVGVPVECAVVRISTVRSTWARFTGTNEAQCPLGDGFVALQLRASTWEVATEGPLERAPCPFPGIPTPVAADLGICRPAPRGAHISCAGG